MPSSKSDRRTQKSNRGQLRIIGGKWRSRKLTFTSAEGLRPTTDRVRETLFNWLAPHLQDARCADLFAGSGALGLEALSRGAGHCSFIDCSGPAIRQIQQHLETLDSSAIAQCFTGSAEQFLAQLSGALDIVFIDPPFNTGLIEPTCRQLSDSHCLAEGAYIYIEAPIKETLKNMPPNWQLYREKAAGEVSYRLFRFEPEATSL